MLPDPLTLKTQVTSGANITVPNGTPASFIRRGPGSFVSTQTPFSVDQQARVIVKANSRVGVESNGLFRLEMDKNVAAINGIPQKDKVCAVWIGYNADFAHFTKADILNVLVMSLDGFQNQLDQMIAGGT